jgi:hypothetical protein
MIITKCRVCHGHVKHLPEYDEPSLGQFWCYDCGEFTMFCLSCMLMTDGDGHVCHVQTTLM